MENNETNSLQTLFYNEKKIRMAWKNDEPFWILKDVCDVMGIKNSRDIVKRLNKDDVDLIYSVDSAGRQHPMIMINEGALYSVVIRSDKPEARKFEHWITHEVLPSIRKHGAYFTKEKADDLLNNPDTIISLINTIKGKEEEIKNLKNKIEEDKPKVTFADALPASQCSIPIGYFTKVLQSNGIDITPNQLFEKLRDAELLIKRKCTDRNSPTQKAMKLKLFSVHESTTIHPDGGITFSRSTKITPKGQMYIVKLLSNKQSQENSNQLIFNFFIEGNAEIYNATANQ
jgi:anti-repressor protein